MTNRIDEYVANCEGYGGGPATKTYEIQNIWGDLLGTYAATSERLALEAHFAARGYSPATAAAAAIQFTGSVRKVK